MADVRSLLRNEQASRRINHPNLSYTKSGLLNCMVCNLIIKSGSLWEGHLKSANHKKNAQKAQNGQNGELQDVNGNASKKRKMSDEAEDVRKKRRSVGVGQDDLHSGEAQGPEITQDLPGDDREDDVAGPVIPDDNFLLSTPRPVTTEASVPTQPPQPAAQPPIDEDEWAAFEREVVPLAHQAPPTRPTDYSSATISAAPVSAAELAAETNAERQQRRDAEVEDEKAEEDRRLVEEFEVMEGLEERVKRLKEKREALRLNVGAFEDGAAEAEEEADEKPPDPSHEEDDSDEIDEWGFA